MLIQISYFQLSSFILMYINLSKHLLVHSYLVYFFIYMCPRAWFVHFMYFGIVLLVFFILFVKLSSSFFLTVFSLQAIHTLKTQNGRTMSLKFLNYAQSNQCKSMRESSVSYASASFTMSWKMRYTAMSFTDWWSFSTLDLVSVQGAPVYYLTTPASSFHRWKSRQ